MRLQQSLLALWVSLVSLCLGITISPLTGGLGMARVLFNDSKDVFSSSSGYSGDPSAMRSFTDGPFGMGKGIILSTGSLASPLAPGDTCPSSYTTDLYDAYTTTYCGADTYNGASYLLNILPTKATTLLIEMVIASCDLISADKVMVLVNGVNYAKDENGTPLTSASKYLSEPWGIPAPNGNTAFAMTSPPLRFSIPLPKTYVELKIAICDRLDGYGDTAVMIKARPCNDCDQPFEVNYDTTSIISTTTYETTSTITQPASGTVRGTISFVTFVTASATSTTSSTSSDSMSSSSLDSPTPTSSDSILSSPLDSASSNSLGSTPSAPSDSTTTTSLYSTSPTTFDSAPSTSSDSMLSTPFDSTSSNSLDLTRLTSWDSTTPTSLGSTPSATSDSALSTPSDSTSSITLPLSTAISHITASTITSSIIPAPTPCNQLDNPYYIDGVEISILCSKQTTGGNQIDFSNLFHSLTECIILCAYNLNCRAVTFDNFANGCTLYDGFNGFISDDNQDVAVVASRPALLTMPPSSAALSTTTSSSAAATASSSTPSGPLSCSQMAGTTYTGPRENKFTLSCDTSSTGASIYRRAEEDIMQGCLDRCDDDSRCIAMDFYPYPHSECRLIESYTGTTPSPGTNFASKIFSSSTTFTSSEFMQSTLSTGVSITLLPSTSLSSLSSISLEATSLSSLLLSISEGISETTLKSISATTLSVSSASTSLITTLLPSTSLSLSIGITSKTTSESALESASLLTASATSSTSSISLPTVLPPLTSILSSKSSFGPTWETASDAASTEVLSSAESTPVTSTATTYSSDTSTITTNVSTTERLTIKTPAVETSSTITPVTEIPPPATGSGLSNTSQVSIEIQSTISTLQSSDFKTISHPLSYVETTGGQTYESTSKSSSLPSSSQTGSSSSSSSLTAIDLVTKTLSVSESTITKMTMESRPTMSYPTLNAIHTAYSTLTIDDSYTKTQFAEIVTTVTYTTIDPSNPAALITTCVPVTLLYTPCMCEHQTYPSVDMTTVACTQGKDEGIVTLTIPKAAYETGTKNYTHPIVQYPSGWIEGVQTDAGGNSYPVVQPTTGSQGGTQPGHKKGQPETPTQAADSQGDFGHSYKSRKPTMTTSAVGFYRNNRPGEGNRQPAIPAKGSPASKSTTLMNPSRASFSNAMTTETNIMPTPQFDTSTVPSQSSLPHQGHGSSVLKEAPYATSMVLSEAHRYHLASWVVMTVVLIVILL